MTRAKTPYTSTEAQILIPHILHLRLKNLPEDLAANRTELQTSITELEKAIKLVKRNLPAQSGFYLYLVLGSMNVNMRSNKLKLNYKIEYEK